MTHRIATLAKQELISILRWYEEIEAGLGAEVADDIEDAIRRATRNPEAYGKFGNLQRRVMCSVFQVGVVYQVRDELLIVTQIMDLRSDPGRWRDR